MLVESGERITGTAKEKGLDSELKKNADKAVGSGRGQVRLRQVRMRRGRRRRRGRSPATTKWYDNYSSYVRKPHSAQQRAKSAFLQ